MKTRLNSEFSEQFGSENRDDKSPSSGNSGNSGIVLSTFPLTELVYEVIGSIPGSYLQVKLMEAELVVIRSDRNLLLKAFHHCLEDLTNLTYRQGKRVLIGLRIYGRDGVGYLEMDCPDLDLTSLSLRTGKNALTLSGHAEPEFGFIVAQIALSKVKASYNILHNRLGGSKLVFEIPKVRGAAS
jgi:hypothetical protein